MGASPSGKGRWVRARRPEHKLERREALLAAARGLLDAEGGEGATLSAIAREAGLSKANCYRYFESREAILLAVILDEVRAWTRDMDAGLRPLSGGNDLDAVAEVFVRTTALRPRLCGLVSSLWAVLERNVSAESIAEFKRHFLEESFVPIEPLAAALPRLSADDAYAFVTFFFLFIAGSWPAANPAPLVVEVLQREEFEGHHLDFESTLRAHAQTLLRGLTARQPEPTS